MFAEVNKHIASAMEDITPIKPLNLIMRRSMETVDICLCLFHCLPDFTA